jgi:hypothetical protein
MSEDLVVFDCKSNWQRERIGLRIHYQSRRLSAVLGTSGSSLIALRKSITPYWLLFLFHPRIVKEPIMPQRDHAAILWTSGVFDCGGRIR